jgi:TonB-dependent Receptor Plug Domain
MRKWGIAAAAACLLWPVGLHAQQSNVLGYPASFFAEARPNTAYDMTSRLPGFTFDDGNTARGFAGTAGNVLINGRRPTSKTDDLQSILQRIPASDVERIDLIRGGAPGIDMQGQTVVANVIRNTADSTKIVADISDNYFLLDHHTIPAASLQYTRQSGDSTYEASIARLGNYDDSVGDGFHNITDAATGIVTHQHARSNGQGFGGNLTGAATVPLFDGVFKANLDLEASPFHSAFYYTGCYRQERQ